MPDRDPRIVGDVERCLRNAGFWITGRAWQKDGSCCIKFTSMAAPLAHFTLSHELLIESVAMEADPVAYAESVDRLGDYIKKTKGTWAPNAKALLN